MKIAVIIDTWFPAVGGGQINAWEISKRLANRGNKVDIITRNNGKWNQKPIKNLRILKLGDKAKIEDNFSRVIFLLRAFRKVTNQGYDVIHLQAFLPGLLSPFIRNFLKKPTVFTVHGTRMFEHSPNKSFGFLLEKIILTKITYDAQISVTKSFLKFPNRNKLIKVISNAPSIKIHKNNYRNSNGTQILWVGRFDPVKRVDYLLKAMKILKEKVPSANLRIIGYGKDEKKIKLLAKDLHLSNVLFVGMKTGDHLTKEYESANLFVLCSESEGQPITILEAQAAGLPVVASNVGGISELVTNNINGVFVDPQDSDAFARGIAYCIKNQRLMSKNSRETSLKRDTWEEITHKTYSLYSRLN